MKIGHINRKTGFSGVQACWTLIGIILFFGGIFSIYSYVGNVMTAAKPLGMVMFLAGLINVCVCFWKSHEIHGSLWLVADGVCAILLSIFPLFNRIISPVMIPFFFCMWELFSGILKVMDSFELKEEKIRCWIGFLFIGWMELASGTASLIKPFDDLIGMNKVIAMIFFVQSLGFILKAVMYKYLIK